MIEIELIVKIAKFFRLKVRPMKILKTALFCVILISTPQALAMLEPAPKSVNIFIKNALTSPLPFIAPPTIVLTYTETTGIQYQETIAPNETELLTKLNAIKDASAIEIRGYGVKKENLISPISISKSDLLLQWANNHQAPNQDLLVTINWMPLSIRSIQSTYMTIASDSHRGTIPQSRNILEVFPQLANKDFFSQLNAEEIRKAKSWNLILIPAGWVAKQVTAEDIYRYILRLPENYTLNDIKKAYRKRALEWHPNGFSQAKREDQEFANQVFILIQGSYEGLTQALEQKSDWTHVN